MKTPHKLTHFSVLSSTVMEPLDYLTRRWRTRIKESDLVVEFEHHYTTPFRGRKSKHPKWSTAEEIEFYSTPPIVNDCRSK